MKTKELKDIKGSMFYQAPSVPVKHQVQIFEKEYTEEGTKYKIIANVRYDDQCDNGHNSFSITGEIWRKGHTKDCETCGCIHKEISEHFPELTRYLKWHFMTSEGPVHYIANTMYHASSKDCWGLEKGEKRQIRSGKSGKLCWILKDFTELEQYIDSDTKPAIPAGARLEYVPLERIGEGKEPDIEAARATAIWPDATLDQLQNRDLLAARLPKLIEEFKRDVESLGFAF